MPRLTFQLWMEEVDRHCVEMTGLNSEDFPDVDYQSWYQEGFSPKEAAKKCIRNAREVY